MNDQNDDHVIPNAGDEPRRPAWAQPDEAAPSGPTPGSVGGPLGRRPGAAEPPPPPPGWAAPSTPPPPGFGAVPGTPYPPSGGNGYAGSHAANPYTSPASVPPPTGGRPYHPSTPKRGGSGSLITLVVVLAIVGVLAAIGFSRTNANKRKDEDAASTDTTATLPLPPGVNSEEAAGGGDSSSNGGHDRHEVDVSTMDLQAITLTKDEINRLKKPAADASWVPVEGRTLTPDESASRCAPNIPAPEAGYGAHWALVEQNGNVGFHGEVVDRVFRFKTATDAHRAITERSTSVFLDCHRQTLWSELGQAGATNVGTVNVVENRHRDDAGRAVVTIRTSTSYTLNGHSCTSYDDEAWRQVGTLVITSDFTTCGEPWDHDLVQRLMDAEAKRAG